MTQWVENPTGGRDRGPRGLVRAWLEVLTRPRRFFENGVAPGDQAPGLTFAVAVAFAHVGGRLLLAPSSLSGYERVAADTGSPYLSAVVVLGVACFLVAPLVLHLAAALSTVSLLAVVDDRAGVGETVQVVAYAAAPVALGWVPAALGGTSLPTTVAAAVGVLLACYGTGLLVVGLSVVHGTSLSRAMVGGFLPALFVFGFVTGGIDALAALVVSEATVAHVPGGIRQPF